MNFHFKETLKKLKDTDWKKVFAARNLIVIGCVLLIGTGVVVTSLLGEKEPDIAAGNESGTKILGNPVLVDASAGEKAGGELNLDTDNDSFFAISVINRQRVRDEAMEVLREVADNPDVLPDTKETALKSIADMVDEMNAEINIETLVKARGFEECVAVISGQKCSVIVKSEELLADDVAQILEIVLESTDIKAADIKIKERQ